jgi:hypothetical protein
MGVQRDWRRVTITMNIDLNRRLKEKQHQMMKENNNISFSRLVNHVLEEGLKHEDLKILKASDLQIL